MFLLSPPCQLESRYANSDPFSGQFSYRILDRRDQNPSILNRLIVQAGLTLTPFLGLIDLVAQIPFTLLSFCFSLPKQKLINRIKLMPLFSIIFPIGAGVDNFLFNKVLSTPFESNDNDSPFYKTSYKLPLCARSFSYLCHYRDSAPTLFRKSFSQLGFGVLAIASLIDTLAQIPFALVQKIFFLPSENQVLRIKQALLTSALSAYAFSKNFFCPEIISAIYSWDRIFSKPLVYLQGGRERLLGSLIEYPSVPITRKLLDQAFEKKLSSKQVSDFLRIHTDGLDHIPSFEIEGFDICKRKQIKAIGYWLGLEGYVEQIDLEGLRKERDKWIVSTLLDSLFRLGASEEFEELTLKKEGLNQLQRALKQLIAPPSHPELARQINKGELTFISAGWNGHHIHLAFFGSYLAIANRGDRSAENLDTMEVFKIDPKKVTTQVLDAIMSHQYFDKERGETFLYKTLPSLLSPINKPLKDAFCKKFKTICPKNQKVGNCALASLKAAVRFAWTALLCGDLNTLDLKNLDSDVFTNGRLESKFFTDWAASTLFPPDKIDQTLFGERAVSQVQKKAQRAEENLTILKALKVTTTNEENFLLLDRATEILNRRSALRKAKSQGESV